MEGRKTDNYISPNNDKRESDNEEEEQETGIKGRGGGGE